MCKYSTSTQESNGICTLRTTVRSALPPATKLQHIVNRNLNASFTIVAKNTFLTIQVSDDSQPSLQRVNTAPAQLQSCGSVVQTNAANPIMGIDACTAAHAEQRFNASSGPDETGVVVPSEKDTMEVAGTPEVDHISFVDFHKDLTCPEVSAKVTDALTKGSFSHQHMMILLLLRKDLLQLCFSRYGCRVVQKAIEVARGADRDLILEVLEDHVTELYRSPHGNYVLARAIEFWPSERVGFVISALLGRLFVASTHNFGCRLVCRLIEHCSDEQLRGILDEVTCQAAALSFTKYGMYVLQTALQHALPLRRAAIVQQLLPNFAALCMNKHGSLVAQSIFDHCDGNTQRAAVHCLLQAEGENSVAEVACSQYGCYVIEQLGLKADAKVRSEIANALFVNLERLQAARNAGRVMAAFKTKLSEMNSRA